MKYQEWTRRQAIQRAGAVIAGGAALGASAAASAPPAYAATPGRLAGAEGAGAQQPGIQLYWDLASRPDLQIPLVTVTADQPVLRHDSGFLFASPSLANPPNQVAGNLIMDWNGDPVWYFDPSQATGGKFGISPGSLAVQSYQGKPVLTWWVGTGTPVDGTFVDAGTYTIADASYTPIANVNAVGSGYTADLHECVLSPQGTAYILATGVVSADLTVLGGPADGLMLDSIIQEIDIATGELLFQWAPLDHIPMNETMRPYSPTLLTDPYHLNSMGLAPDGDLIVGARHTCAVYKVSRATGEIVWRLGGNRSDFSMGPGASFAWQHHAALHGNGVVSIFDNENWKFQVGSGTPSRAIFLQLDYSSMQASLIKAYTRPGGVVTTSHGSVQVLEKGRVLVGWGDKPLFSEFSSGGEMLLDGAYPAFGDTEAAQFLTYRTLSFDWVGTPTEPPAAAVRPGATGGAVVYASWNGATEVARWTVLAGRTAASLRTVGARPRAGFETSIPVSDCGPYFVAVAVGARDQVLGRSAPVTLSGA